VDNAQAVQGSCTGSHLLETKLLGDDHREPMPGGPWGPGVIAYPHVHPETIRLPGKPPKGRQPTPLEARDKPAVQWEM
jgi:hypothetical protein